MRSLDWHNETRYDDTINRTRTCNVVHAQRSKSYMYVVSKSKKSHGVASENFWCVRIINERHWWNRIILFCHE